MLNRIGTGLDVEEIDVGGCEMSEDMMAVRLEYSYMVGRERECVMVFVAEIFSGD